MVTTAAMHALHALGIAVVIAVVGASGVGVIYGIRRVAASKSVTTN
jgi:hypothetical protein